MHIIFLWFYWVSTNLNHSRYNYKLFLHSRIKSEILNLTQKMDNIEKLERLQKLKESGILSEKEFEVEKIKILLEKDKSKFKFKKKSLIYVAIIGLIGVANVYLWYSGFFNNDRIKNDLSNFGLNGKVKFIIEASDESYSFKDIYGFNKDGFLLYKNIANGYEINTFTRDKLNRTISSKFFQNQRDEGILFRNRNESNYTYNDLGRLVEVIKSGVNYNEDFTNFTKYTYDDKGSVIKIVTSYDTVEYLIKYDKNDSVIEKVEKPSNYKSKFLFNKDGLVIEHKEFNDEGKLISVRKYKYNKLGKKIEEEYFNEEKKIWSNRFIYDESNFLISEEINWYNKGWRKYYEYTNDSNGNWIKRAYFNDEGEASFTYRKIEYYSDEELESPNEFDFIAKFGSGELKENELKETVNQSNSYGEIRGRLIGGNSAMVKRELGEPLFVSVASSFIEENYNMRLSIGLYDTCLGYKVYYYADYFGESGHLLVVLSQFGKVTNVIPESAVENVNDICCCE